MPLSAALLSRLLLLLAAGGAACAVTNGGIRPDGGDSGASAWQPSIVCNGPVVTFEPGIPPDWTVVDDEGGGVAWSSVAGSGEEANYTGGDGEAASVSSDLFNDAFGQTEFDTELRTSSFSVAGYESASLHYLANYQHVTFPPIERDYLDLDVSTDGGSHWVTLLGWQEDHGTFRNTPGQAVEAGLAGHMNSAGLMARWHYYDPHTGDNGWYAQVDEVRLLCWVTTPWGDVDCSGAVNAVDALKVLRHASGLSLSQSEPCPDMGLMVNAGFVTIKQLGDVDCGSSVNSVDALKILRFVSGLSVAQTGPCPAMGATFDLYY